MTNKALDGAPALFKKTLRKIINKKFKDLFGSNTVIYAIIYGTYFIKRKIKWWLLIKSGSEKILSCVFPLNKINSFIDILRL